jgi:hypothetical protein
VRRRYIAAPIRDPDAASGTADGSAAPDDTWSEWGEVPTSPICRPDVDEEVVQA